MNLGLGLLFSLASRSSFRIWRGASVYQHHRANYHRRSYPDVEGHLFTREHPSQQHRNHRIDVGVRSHQRR